MKKHLALLLAVLMLVLTGCGNKAPSTDEVTRESITLVNTAPIPDYDPLNWYISSQSTMFTNVYSTLVDVVVNEDLSISCRPNLAESWDQE